jgi:membrane protein required for colicin V production
MQLYDLVMIAILGGAALFGAWKGLAWQIASVASMVVSYFAAYQFRDSVAPMIKAEAPWNKFGAMLAIFVVTSLLIWIAFRLVRDVIDRVKLREFDRQVGFVAGAAKGVLYCVLVTFFVVTLWPSGREQVLQSRSGVYVAKLIDRADAVMPAEVKQVLGPYLDRLEQGLDPNAPAPTPAFGSPSGSGNPVPVQPRAGQPRGFGVPASLSDDTTGATGNLPFADRFDETVRDATQAAASAAFEAGSRVVEQGARRAADSVILPARTDNETAPDRRSFYDR